MFSNLIWMFILLCSSVADENSIRDADIFPSSPVIERGSSLELSCVLRKNYMPQRNASHIIWKLNDTLIAPENYNIVNETVSNVTIHNFTHSIAYVNCSIKYLDEELPLAYTEVKSGFRPDIPENISCIYFYDANLTCTWNVGRETSLTTNYTLYRKQMHSQYSVKSCQNATESCSFFPPNNAYNNDFCFQVEAKNVLGESLTECVPIPLQKIEKFAPPEILSVKKIPGIKQLLTVTWKMPEKIIPLKSIICQLQYRNLYSNFTEFVNVSLNSKKGHVIGSCNLTGLWDSTDYSVAIRCINNESVFWSGWSGEKNGSTEEKAPSGKVDLWRVIESSHSSGNRTVHLLWKPLKSFPPSGRILGYKIQYFPEKKPAHKRTNNSTEKKITLLLNEEAHIISVTAYNSAGESPEAILRIPSIDEKPYQVIETVMTSTTNEEVVVQWITSEPETTKYVVEWYEELEMDPFSRSWQYVSNSTEWKNNKKNFKPFICYNISVYPLYGSNVAAPSYAQIYAQEKEPSEGPVADTGIPGKNEVTIKWNEISKAKRNGFITNYTIFYKPEDGKELNETVNSDVLQYRLKSLQANTQYTVQIMASNKAGGTIGEQKIFKTLKFDEEDFFFIAIPVGVSMLCLIGLWITCVLKKHAFKKVCWPDIPNPEESLAVEWPLASSMNNSFLKRVSSQTKSVDFEDINVLEYCFPEESQEGSLLINYEKHVSECTDINTKDITNRDEKILRNEENEVAKCFSPSMPYIIAEQFTRSQVHSALIPVKEAQPIEMVGNVLCGSQQNPIKNEENDDEDVLKLEDFSEKALFNPYLKNSVKTREFLVSESLPEHSIDEHKSQSSVSSPFQPNVPGQSYITLDMFRLAKAQ
ncbi:interleukin-31 receptor subunit alpha [Oenanthe melanoleuca]|uniref:interleukin-31 receptor subunit alpha n=1 Tax=Oenanthe melanoleuca TaxID=2939378 RepID=UPI0024C1EE45|nr:interleukin-31 receptor subunit alpha [Oenanthe melanoleuca]XP_056369468.1 interleukin-31 receptor subunit alpha [Oenanthe melanoleuca]XP_056369469.1 interleukin-31 receptor subunit alpha [Oenanthe melanoleuca]